MISHDATAIPRGIYRYRWLVLELVLRDLRIRYRGSALGLAWTFINPLIFTCIYTLVFGVFLHTDVPNYPVYLLSALLPWTWLSGALQQSTAALVDGRMYVGKTIFPIEILVLVPVLSHGWNFLCSIPMVFLIAALFKVHPGMVAPRAAGARADRAHPRLRARAAAGEPARLLSRRTATRRIRPDRGPLSDADLLRRARRSGIAHLHLARQPDRRGDGRVSRRHLSRHRAESRRGAVRHVVRRRHPRGRLRRLQPLPRVVR